MSISLQYQTVYCPRERVMKPVTAWALSISLLIVVCIFKISLKASAVEYGYDLADYKKLNQTMIKEKNELELQKAILLRADHFKAKALALGMQNISPKQIVYLRK